MNNSTTKGKVTQTIAEFGFVGTFIALVLALFGVVSWYTLLLPLPIALTLGMFIWVVWGAYERFRN